MAKRPDRPQRLEKKPLLKVRFVHHYRFAVLLARYCWATSSALKRVRRDEVKKRIPGFILVAFMLAFWELACARGLVDPVSMPRVSTIFTSWFKAQPDGELLAQLAPTLWRIAVGFGFAVLVSVPLGLLMGTVSFIYRLLEPITEDSFVLFQVRPTFPSPFCFSGSATR